jgi:SAM-dependent methyltransferase
MTEVDPTSLRAKSYSELDPLYIELDKGHVRRTRNIRLIPAELHRRRGGKYSYAEWAHVIGIFQTLLYLHLDKKQDNIVLDAGCGTGLMAIASEIFLGQRGRYTGIDVSLEDIEFCRSHYDPARFSFMHLDTSNAMYAPSRGADKARWDVQDNTVDMVTALSLWTHLNEDDARHYFSEIGRVLKLGGRAMITFFFLDALYADSLPSRGSAEGRFHSTLQDRWIFDQPSYGSDAWFHPRWARVPENAIGLTPEGLERLLDGSGLRETAYYPGNWKEVPGAFFQDVLVFQKAR